MLARDKERQINFTTSVKKTGGVLLLTCTEAADQVQKFMGGF